MKEKHIVSGRVYYPSGKLYFEGTYDDSCMNNLRPWKPATLCEGIVYYENGNKYREGIFQWCGLLKGKEYYPNGHLKFEGTFNNKDSGNGGNYYGPSYPVEGKFYSEEGLLVYEGKFIVSHMNGVGYPEVLKPEGYGPLN